MLRLAGAITQLLCAGCLLLGTIAFVLVQQHGTGGAGYVIGWAIAALVGLVAGGLAPRGGLASLVACAVIDLAFGAVLLALDEGTLRAALKVLPASDVDDIAGALTAVGAALLGAAGLCLLAVPQAIRYTRWLHDETEPRPAGSTARGFPPPPVSAARGSVWQLPESAPDEGRPRRRMYFALAGFAIGFGAGIGVLVSSGAQPEPAAPAAAGSAGSGGAPAARTDTPGATADPGPGSGAGAAATLPPAADPGAADGAPAVPVAELIEAQRAALAAGDLAALGAMLAPGVFGFGADAADVAEGRDAVAALLAEDVGELVRGGADVVVRSSHTGEAHGHAWIALELEIAARDRTTRRFAVTQLAAWQRGAWTVVAWHWAVPVLDATAERMMVLGTKPTPAPIPPAPGAAPAAPADLDAAVRAAFGSRAGFTAARSDHVDGFNFGSGPNERIVGGAAVRRVFGKLRAELRLHDGIRVAAAGAWDPALAAAPPIAFAAANVDFTTRTRAATDLTQTFRVLAILLREDGAWRLVQTQWSHGGPVR